MEFKFYYDYSLDDAYYYPSDVKLSADNLGRPYYQIRFINHLKYGIVTSIQPYRGAKELNLPNLAPFNFCDVEKNRFWFKQRATRFDDITLAPNMRFLTVDGDNVSFHD